MMVVKAFSGVVGVVFEMVVIVPFCIILFDVMGFRPVWDG